MSDGISIEGVGFAEIEARLAKLIEACIDLRPFWPLLIPLYVRWMGEQFEGAGEFFGEQWQPLTPDYAAWKSEHYPGRGLLMADGDLRHAAQTPRREAYPNMLVLTIEPFIKQRGPGKGRQIRPEWFQDGTDRMVARPLLSRDGMLPASAQMEVASAAEFYLADTARRLGLM